jgi:uncharacterized protein YciW
MTNTPDAIDAAVALAPGDPTWALRRQREKVVAATQGSYDAMFSPAVEGLSVHERLLVALHACRVSGAGGLAASGLSTPAIVAMSQLIAFLSYQIRLAAGLQALAAAEANA